ncbi:MAG: Sapep family Mn(2+)-dependent dipeptidase [Kineothrix sp.]|nr:Sapep family Mn(2+)-dependent dipeptidase [Kineothrix sp.]
MDKLNFEKIFMDSLGELQGLVQIPSVYDEKTVSEEMPYGEGSWRVLDYMRQIAFRDGFEVLEYDNHAIAVRIEPKEMRVDVVSHLDVVEPGEGWEWEPFSAAVENGYLIGRGTEDMKVCAWLTYLALRMIKEQKLPFTREIRLVFGCDEERTMADMYHYVDKAGKPEFAFTPDGIFPMSIGEKGALMWRLKGSYQGICKWLHGGVQCNVIPPCARACFTDVSLEQELRAYIAGHGYDISCTMENGELVLESHGQAAHASMPHLGHSAVTDLLDVIVGVTGDAMLDSLSRCFGEPYGSGIGLKAEESIGDFTVNLGVLKIEKGNLYGEVDGRYPYGITSREATERVKKACTEEIEISLDYDDAPNLCEREDSFVQELLAVYREKTGDFSEPVISGGVSYSKVFGHCVAFGPIDKPEESLAHKANEKISLDRCVKLLEIYYEAMCRIASLK